MPLRKGQLFSVYGLEAEPKEVMGRGWCLSTGQINLITGKGEGMMFQTHPVSKRREQAGMAVGCNMLTRALPYLFWADGQDKHAFSGMTNHEVRGTSVCTVHEQQPSQTTADLICICCSTDSQLPLVLLIGGKASSLTALVIEDPKIKTKFSAKK